MFLGHFAVGLALKKTEPRVPLGVWFAAGQFLDILWPVFLLTGIEKVSVEPGITVVTPLNLQVLDWSHSLAMVCVWSLLFGLVVYWRVRSRNAFVFTALAVASHWLLDYATHRPDMPLWPHSEKFGLGIWNSLPATLVLELGMFCVAVYIYARSIGRVRRAVWINLTLMVVVLIAIYAGSVFGPPPPNNQKMLAVSTLSLVPVLIFWANWIDKQARNHA